MGCVGWFGWLDVGNCFCALDGTIAPTGRTTETLSQHAEEKKHNVWKNLCVNKVVVSISLKPKARKKAT